MTIQIAYALKIIENLAEKRDVLFHQQVKSIQTYPTYYSPKARIAVKVIANYQNNKFNV
jgi:hypothetical protein